MWECPEIPIGKFAVETLVEQLNVEDFFPCSMELVEILDAALVCRELSQRKGGQNVQMPWMWLADGDALDESDLAQHIFVFFALVHTTVDHCERKQTSHFEQHHDRHRKDTVDLASDVCELAARVVSLA